MRIKDARALPSVAQEDLRRKAVAAVRAGKTQVEVAALFGVTRRAVSNWVSAVRQGGMKALKGKVRGRPKGGSLGAAEAAWVKRMLVDRRPDQLKLPFYLWTREAVAQLIERKFAMRLSVWTVGRYLAAWGFTPQKPVRRAFEQNPAAVRRWLKEEYPAIRRLAKREGAEIYWGDEMGLRSEHAAGRAYARKGQTPLIPGTGQRFGCNMLSGITNRGRLNFMVFKKRFRADVFLEFVKRLARQADRKVYLIVDEHPVHRAKKVRAWVKRNAPRIRLFFLPSYSPELNPDEMLNQDVKSNAVGRKRPHAADQLVQSVRSYLRSRQRRPHIIRNYFNEPHVRYAAAA